MMCKHSWHRGIEQCDQWYDQRNFRHRQSPITLFPGGWTSTWWRAKPEIYPFVSSLWTWNPPGCKTPGNLIVGLGSENFEGVPREASVLVSGNSHFCMDIHPYQVCCDISCDLHIGFRFLFYQEYCNLTDSLQLTWDTVKVPEWSIVLGEYTTWHPFYHKKKDISQTTCACTCTYINRYEWGFFYH